jgi:4'-phosphopantetheinyl transferase
MIDKKSQVSLAHKADFVRYVAVQELINGSLSMASLMPDLVPGEIHVWCLQGEIGDALLEHFWLMLSHQERARANAFHKQRDRVRFIVRHWTLRMLMSHYVGVKPGMITFTRGQYGKPSLLWPQAKGLNFSLSQTEGVALLSFAYTRAIGVDIEKEKNIPDLMMVGNEVFSDRELKTLQAREGVSRMRRFFTMWTRKEAYLKALGLGFGVDPRQVTLLDAPQLGNGRFQLVRDMSIARLWSLFDLAIEPGIKAAMAVEQQSTTVKLFRFTLEENGASGIFIDQAGTDS